MYYAAYNVNYLPTFRDNQCDRLWYFISLSFKMGLISCHETSLRNYHYTMSSFQEERWFQLVNVVWEIITVYPENYASNKYNLWAKYIGFHCHDRQRLQRLLCFRELDKITDNRLTFHEVHTFLTLYRRIFDMRIALTLTGIPPLHAFQQWGRLEEKCMTPSSGDGKLLWRTTPRY